MINIPKGTKDVLPNEAYKWHYIEDTVRTVAKSFCFREIRTPVFEHTELFLRGVGETTDIVSKEMYTFLDKGERSITLKPEGTAGVARSFIENGLSSLAQPTKMYYITPVFRYEKPQAGRLREHHQFGVELYGSELPEADVEVMTLALAVFEKLGIEKLSLKINSIGCKTCRAKYNELLKLYLSSNISKMCATCKERLEKNPLRILDCKEEYCASVNKKAPKIIDHLCPDCNKHHEEVVKMLTSLKVNFEIDPNIVRGLDYYTRTVFEFVSNNIGAQGTVCGGGRYNHLVEEVGGKPCAAVGFGMGIERLLLTLEKLGLQCGAEHGADAYIAPICEGAREIFIPLANKLRQDGLAVEVDLLSRSLKAQMKYADKIGTKNVIIIGEDELSEGKAQVKDMTDGTTSKIDIAGLGKYLLDKKKLIVQNDYVKEKRCSK